MRIVNDISESWIRFLPLGEGGLVVDFDRSGAGVISAEINRQILWICAGLKGAMPEGLIEYVPAFTSLTVYCDPLRYNQEQLIGLVKRMFRASGQQPTVKPVIRTIPVCYGGAEGPDLRLVAEHAGLTDREIIALHTQQEYQVYMIGFAPGFPYLGGMDERIATPRKAEPRLKIPAGSVGIAGRQTGVYSLETPGGWQIIGRTPLDLFDVSREEPALLKAGDRVRFQEISVAEFAHIKSTNTSVTDTRRHQVVPVDRRLGEAGLEVVKPGLLTTIQDLGRIGYQRSGISVSGAMDAFALRIGNLLLGNAEGEAALECTMIGPILRFDSARWISVTGADLSPSVDGVPLAMWRPVYMAAGSVLSFGKMVRGVRSYICFKNGLDVPVILRSRSTYLLAGIGGWKGRALRAGDRIPFRGTGDTGSGASVPDSQGWSLVPGFYPDLSPSDFHVIRIIKGPEWDWFSPQTSAELLKHTYTVGPASDRMGFRLEGPALSLKESRELLSSAVTFGTIQVPGGGGPIVLMADRQTTGGYPRIGQVAHVDLCRLSQCRPGERLRFDLISLREAQHLYAQREQQLSRLELAVSFKWNNNPENRKE